MPVSPFGSESQQLRNNVLVAEACSRSQHPVDVCAVALRLLLLAAASGQPRICSQQSFKEVSVQESGSRATATRVSDTAVWDDLTVTS